MQSLSDSVPNQDLNCASPSTSSHMIINNSAMDSASAAAAAVAGNSNDFKNLTSLGEVQRIIGLSLSKIQLGRNQRGGLPLHKNLLVATVLNKARDLYMQETMYMNYKMMVNGQFAAAAASASNHHQGGISAASNMMQAAAAGVHQSPYGGGPHGYHYGQGANHHSNACDQEDLEPQTEANEADYDEDSESDVEDECDQPIVSSVSGNNNNNLRSAMVGAQANLAAYSAMQQQHNNQVLQSPGGMTNSLHSNMPLQPNNNNNKPVAGNSNAVQQQQQQQQQQQNSDEGFIEDPDCDCDARNYGTSESRVPFQYCYHCAPFHPSNGRGPTLVPSPSCPSSSSGHASGSGDRSSSSITSSAVSSTATTSMMLSSSSSTVTSSTMTSSSSATTTTTTLYDMDAQVTHAGQLSSPSRGTKRCRSLSLDTTEDDDDENDILDEMQSTKKKRRESSSEDSSSSSPDTSLQDESGYQSDSSQHEMFHPAFRGATSSTPTSETCSVVPGGPGSGGQTMEIDQITSLVSIFSFGQQIMAAAAAANKSTRTSTSVGGNTVGSSSSSSPPPPQGGQDLEDAEDKKGEAGGGGPSSEDSDSESDTSSDSGHSSDDHEAAKEAEELSSSVVVSQQPPDLCTTTVPSAVASEAPPCVEVASL